MRGHRSDLRYFRVRGRPRPNAKILGKLHPLNLLHHASRECRVCSDTHLQYACLPYLLREFPLEPFPYAPSTQIFCDHGHIHFNALLGLRSCIELVGEPIPPILVASN